MKQMVRQWTFNEMIDLNQYHIFHLEHPNTCLWCGKTHFCWCQGDLYLNQCIRRKDPNQTSHVCSRRFFLEEILGRGVWNIQKWLWRWLWNIPCFFSSAVRGVFLEEILGRPDIYHQQVDYGRWTDKETWLVWLVFENETCVWTLSHVIHHTFLAKIIKKTIYQNDSNIYGVRLHRPGMK